MPESCLSRVSTLARAKGNSSKEFLSRSSIPRQIRAASRTIAWPPEKDPASPSKSAASWSCFTSLFHGGLEAALLGAELSK